MIATLRFLKRFLFQPGVCYFGAYDTALSNSGWLGSTTISSVASTVNAGIYAWASQYAAQKQYDIAKKYWQMAQEMRDYWNEYYRPIEIGFAIEVCSEPVYVPQHKLIAGRFAINVKKQIGDLFNVIAQRAPRYCTGVTKAVLRDSMILQSRAVGDAMNYGFRYEDSRKEAKDDVRFSRRVTMLGIGRGLLQQAFSYAAAAAGMYGKIGAGMAQGLKDAMGSAGYSSGRNAGSDASQAMRKEGGDLVSSQGVRYNDPGTSMGGMSGAEAMQTMIGGNSGAGAMADAGMQAASAGSIASTPGASMGMAGGELMGTASIAGSAGGSIGGAAGGAAAII